MTFFVYIFQFFLLSGGLFFFASSKWAYVVSSIRFYTFYFISFYFIIVYYLAKRNEMFLLFFFHSFSQQAMLDVLCFKRAQQINIQPIQFKAKEKRKIQPQTGWKKWNKTVLKGIKVTGNKNCKNVVFTRCRLIYSFSVLVSLFGFIFLHFISGAIF